LQKAREALAGRDVVGLAPFLYERLEVNKQPVLTGGTDFEEIKKVSPYWMVKGEYPKAGEREILLGAEMASKIARDTDKLIGQTVSVSAGEGKAMLSFTVSGIVSTGGKEEQFAFLNLDELQKIVEKPGAVGLAQLSVVADGDSLKSVEDAIRTANIGIEPQEVQQIAHSEFNVLKKLEVLILLVTIIVLILTLICVTTTMTAGEDAVHAAFERVRSAMRMTPEGRTSSWSSSARAACLALSAAFWAAVSATSSHRASASTSFRAASPLLRASPCSPSSCPSS